MYLKIGLVLGLLWMVAMLYGFRLGGAIYIVLAAAIAMTVYGLNQWWRRPA